MNARNLNNLRMWRAEMAILRQHQDTWANNEGFAETVDILQSYIDAAEAVAGVQVKGLTTGITKDKESIAEDAARKTLIVLKLARAYARSIQNNTLIDLLDVTESNLTRTAGVEFETRMTTLLDAALAVKDKLVKYGFEDNMETEARAAINAYKQADPTTRLAITGRATSTATLPQIISGGKDTLLMIDDMIGLFEKQDQKLVADFRSTRNVVDYGSRHNDKDAPPALPVG